MVRAARDGGAAAGDTGSCAGFDLIVNTVAAAHHLDPFVTPSPTIFNLLLARRAIAGSGIGGAADIEMIAPERVNAAYERMLKGDVKYRFVIDMKKL